VLGHTTAETGKCDLDVIFSISNDAAVSNLQQICMDLHTDTTLIAIMKYIFDNTLSQVKFTS